MGRRGPALNVEITEGAIRVMSRGRTLTLRAVAPPPDADNAPDFIIRLDDLEFWDAPDAAEEIAIEDLSAICEAIEKECDAHGLSVEFD